MEVLGPTSDSSTNGRNSLEGEVISATVLAAEHLASPLLLVSSRPPAAGGPLPAEQLSTPLLLVSCRPLVAGRAPPAGHLASALSLVFSLTSLLLELVSSAPFKPFRSVRLRDGAGVTLVRN